VGGVVEVVLMPGKKVEHLGIKIELVGTIGTARARAVPTCRLNCAICGGPSAADC